MNSSTVTTETLGTEIPRLYLYDQGSEINHVFDDLEQLLVNTLFEPPENSDLDGNSLVRINSTSYQAGENSVELAVP